MSPKNPRVFPITITNPIIENYCLTHSSKLPEVLHEIEKYTKANILAHRMLSNHIQAYFLITISQMIKPGRILEIGTFTGYSAICLAQGLIPKGELISIEKNKQFVEISQHFFQKYNYPNIKVIHNDGIQAIKEIKGNFDLIYLDADKERYAEYLDKLLPLLSQNGWLVIDNTLWKGLVSEEPKEPITKILQEFNEHLSQRQDLFVAVLPIRDGMTIVKKCSTS